MTDFIRRLTAGPAPTISTLVVAVAVFHVVAPTRAWAYLDPITGSIVLQVLAAGFLAAAATFRRSREWFAGVLKKWTTGRKR